MTVSQPGAADNPNEPGMSTQDNSSPLSPTLPSIGPRIGWPDSSKTLSPRQPVADFSRLAECSPGYAGFAVDRLPHSVHEPA